MCQYAKNPVFLGKSGLFDTATHTRPCAKTMHGARENGALCDPISPLHRFRAQHSHSSSLYGCDDPRERFKCDDTVCRNTRLSSSRCALCRSQRSPMMENAAGSCELSLLRNRSDGRVGCCLRQQPTPVKRSGSKTFGKSRATYRQGSSRRMIVMPGTPVTSDRHVAVSR